jgi:predicted metalloprotease with PDZ domain
MFGVAAALTASLALAPPAVSADATLAYRLTYARAGATDVRVEIRLPPAAPGPAVFVMPRAIPMGYGEQHYDAFVLNMAATAADGSTLAVTRQEGPRWLIPAGAVAVSYAVDIRRMEAGVMAASDTSKVRDGYLGLLGYSVFGYVEGREDAAVALEIEGPAGWPVVSTLGAGSHDSRTSVVATDFYALADSQVVMGPRVSVVPIAGTRVPLTLLVYAEVPVDVERVARAASKAFTRVADYFGDIPFPRYTILQEVVSPVSDAHRYNFSMEHLDSMTSTLTAELALTADAPATAEARAVFNLAHHIAHAWVPKRASGTGYFPFQWELAPLIDTIWFAEGFGQYAAIMAIAAGEPDPAAYRERMLQRRFRETLVAAPPFLRRLGLVDLSRVASTRYSEDFRTGQLVFSRGGLLAADIDDRIRTATGGRQDLRDVFRAMVARLGPTHRAFAVGDLPRIIADATGVDVSAIYAEALGPLDQVH